MIRKEKNWSEFVYNLCELAKSYGYELDEPVFSCCCGGGEYTTIIRYDDGREYRSVTANDISDLADEIEEALKENKGTADCVKSLVE